MKADVIGIIGLGRLGRGISAALLGCGCRVIGIGRTDDEVQQAIEMQTKALQEMVQHGACDVEMAKDAASRFEGLTEFAAVEQCHFVIESVTEDIDVKTQVLDEIEQVASSTVPIATNTSAIPIHWLQSRCRHPERVLGMHWAEPAYATRFLELIRGEKTSDFAVRQALDLAHRCGKEVCVIDKDVPGFVANRLGYAIIREAMYLLESGVADAETIDRSFRNSIGLWAGFCGPLRWIDISGGPGLYAKAMKPVLPTLSKADTPPATLEQAAQRVGQSSTLMSGLDEESADRAGSWESRFHDHAWGLFLGPHREQMPEDLG